jgi:hypothetical protein
VFFFHEEAAEAIADGLSPYSDAVTVPNGAPEGDPYIVGYPYPPVTLVPYAVGSWLGDSRWTSLAAWLATLAMIGAASLRRDGTSIPLGVMVAAAAIPGWPLILTSAWTEPLSLTIVGLAIVTWSRPWFSGLMSGLFVGSKQYLVAGSPLLVFNEIPAKWKRATAAAIGLVIAFAPILYWGLSDFIDAAVRFHLEAPARRDGSSVVGLLAGFGIDWAPPPWLMALAVVIVVAALARQVDSATRWIAAVGVTLTVTLFLSGQAFANYWFLIAGMAALGAVSVDKAMENAAAIDQSLKVDVTGLDT